MNFFKLIMIYIIMFVFLIAPLSYSSDTNTVYILKKGSVITPTLYNMRLFILFSKLKEKTFIELMVKKKRLGSTKKNINVIIIDIIKETDSLNIVKIKLKNNPNIVFYAMHYNISCYSKKTIEI